MRTSITLSFIENCLKCLSFWDLFICEYCTCPFVHICPFFSYIQLFFRCTAYCILGGAECHAVEIKGELPFLKKLCNGGNFL